METISDQIQKHERLIYYIVRRMFHGYEKIDYIANTRGMDSDDIIQAGRIGLWKAIETFDDSKGAKFGTYAAKIIRNEIHNQVLSKLNIKGVPLHIDTPTRVKMTMTKDISKLDSTKYEKSMKIENDVIHKLIFDDIYNRLNEKERVVVDMREEGHSYSEIAKVIGCSKANIGLIYKEIGRRFKRLNMVYS